ncbi:hypothetical protein [Actinotalea solisilvae]|uniref:hypothetical protein n=1 Tax=Actinotalea solisilvae TaxID=2072922 RepID=UPI0018F127DF|nr:hypothetical protein [Actinotalea solisilvae]
MFSEAQYQAVIDELNSGMAQLSGHLGRINPTIQAATNHWYIPDWVADALVACGNKLMEAGRWIVEKIGELLEGAAAPVLFFWKAYDWHSGVGGPASQVAGNTSAGALRATFDWSGDAATAYTRAVSTQPTAAAEIQAISTTMATSLGICAAAGLAFYVALGIILVKVIAATIAAIAAFGSVVFSPAGVAIIIEEAAVSGAMIWAAIGSLTALLAAQANQIVAMKGAASAGDAFPRGAWPVGTV